MKAKIRTFTERGLAEFKEYIHQGQLSITPPPKHLLLDERFAIEIGYARELEDKQFVTKFDMGIAVAVAVGKDNLQKLFADDQAWPWLSLFLSDSTMPKKGDEWFLGASSRHVIEKIPGRYHDQSHRHLVKGAVINVARFGTHARVLMDRPDGQSKIEEQVMSRKTGLQLSTSAPFITVLNKLYWNDENNAIRKGAKGGGPGSIMRLIQVLNQFDRTYDIGSMNVDDIINLLPQGEFDRFLNPVKTRKPRPMAASMT